MTPLNFAAGKGHMDIVKFLTLEKHCDPMSRDRIGNTALHHAILNGQLETVKFLIEKLKCPPDITGFLNLTPLQLASCDPDIAQYLQKHSVIPYIRYDETDWAPKVVYVQCVLNNYFSFL